MQLFYCPAKVNIYLRILDKRGDGYHNIRSIFLPINTPCDIMEIDINKGGNIEIECNIKELEKENILFKVYKEFCSSFGIWPGISIKLKKNIPMGAGLGGGSSNGACLLKYLCEKYSIDLNDSKIIQIAKKCGADIPFFLKNKPCIVEGIGDKIREIDLNFEGHYLVVICPDIQISTAWAYKKIDEKRESQGSDNLTIKDIDIKNSARLLGHVWVNDFEEIVFDQYLDLINIKARCYKLSARACVLSGSGSSFVALFSRQISIDVIKEFFQTENIQIYVN